MCAIIQKFLIFDIGTFSRRSRPGSATLGIGAPADVFDSVPAARQRTRSLDRGPEKPAEGEKLSEHEHEQEQEQETRPTGTRES